MNRRHIIPIALAGFALLACDNLPLIGKKTADTTTTTTAAAPVDTMPVDTATPPPAPMQPAVTTPRPRPVMHDQPWTPTDTGTVTPGMSRMDVVAVWGVPVTERTAGAWTYLYFRNGCEVSCGTFDVVFLDNDKVVDAIVRGAGHHYAGTSSSPRDRAAEPTLPASGAPAGAAT